MAFEEKISRRNFFWGRPIGLIFFLCKMQAKCMHCNLKLKRFQELSTAYIKKQVRKLLNILSRIRHDSTNKLRISLSFFHLHETLLFK